MRIPGPFLVALVCAGLIGWFAWWDSAHPFVCVASHREQVTRCIEQAGRVCTVSVERVENLCDRWEREP